MITVDLVSLPAALLAEHEILKPESFAESLSMTKIELSTLVSMWWCASDDDISLSLRYHSKRTGLAPSCSEHIWVNLLPKFCDFFGIKSSSLGSCPAVSWHCSNNSSNRKKENEVKKQMVNIVALDECLSVCESRRKLDEQTHIHRLFAMQWAL